MERAIKIIGELLPADAIVSVDIGQNMLEAAKTLKIKENGRMFISGGFAAMGCSFTEAIGMSIALGKKPVYSIVGDGGLQMNIQEFQTIIREELPLIIFVVNNNALGLIKLFQDNNLNSNYIGTVDGHGYSSPDFCKIAKAYGLTAYKVTDINKLSEYENEIKSPSQAILFDIII